jgi:hypothetical protein
MGNDSDKPESAPEQSCVLAARDYADITHLENPSVIERVLSGTRAEAAAYVSNLLQSGVSRYVLAGPRVAFTAMVIEALTDLSREILAWKRAGTIPDDFSGRPSGYQTWVDLLKEIDSNPVDAERLKALKAMFLAANRINATDGESILAYQLFQIGKRLSSGELLLLKAVYEAYQADDIGRGPGRTLREWANSTSRRLGYQNVSLVLRHERVLVEEELLYPRPKVLGRDVFPPRSAQDLDEAVFEGSTGRITDLGIAFCRNVENYGIAAHESTEPL